MAAFRTLQQSVAADVLYLKYKRNARHKAQQLRNKALSLVARCRPSSATCEQRRSRLRRSRPRRPD
eukprot:2026490-Pleurochrysis_carterae.AAC.7